MEKAMSKYDSHNLWAWILQVYTAMDRARKQELFKYNINRSQGSVLTIVHTLGNEATLAEISQMLFRKTNTVSEILSRMEKQGLVKRVKDLKERNRVRILLTEKGIKASHQASKRENIKRIMSCLTKEERHQLRLCCQKLYDKALEELRMQPNKNWPL
jgi:DNA-binding MarR family transcriptional regulator